MPPILYLGLLILSLIWGASFLFIKILLASFSPLGIVFFRSLFGAAIILIIMLIMRKPILSKNVSLKIVIFVGLFNSLFPWALIGFSETLLSSSMASILNATTPIWTTMIGIILFKSKVTPVQWLGIAIGFIGILILLEIDFNQLKIDHMTGFFAMMAATLFYGLSAQMSRRYFQEISTFQISLYTLLVSTVSSGALIAVTDSFHWSYLLEKPTVLFAVIGLGSFGSGIAYLIFYYIIQKGSAEFASLVTYLVPVTAIFWGVTLLNEELRPTMLMGLALILFGVYISGQKKLTLFRQKLKKELPYQNIE